MGSAHHRYVSKLNGSECELLFKATVGWEDDILERMMEHEGVRKVINILRGAREMQVFLEVAQASFVLIELLFEEVLNSFDVMVGDGLNLLNSSSISDRKIFEDLVHESFLALDKSDVTGILCYDLFSEEFLEPLKLDENTVSL